MLTYEEAKDYFQVDEIKAERDGWKAKYELLKPFADLGQRYREALEKIQFLASQSRHLSVAEIKVVCHEALQTSTVHEGEE